MPYYGEKLYNSQSIYRMGFKDNDELSRRAFLVLSGMLGCGAVYPVFGGKEFSQAEGANMSNKHLKWWLNTFMSSLQEDDKRTGLAILADCGRACMESHFGKKLNDLKAEIDNLNNVDEIVVFMNKNHLGSGNIVRKGDCLYDRYPKCYCPTMSSGIIESPVFCNCTRGFNKALFEAVFDKPVQVKIEKSVARGDDCCLIKVNLKSR